MKRSLDTPCLYSKTPIGKSTEFKILITLVLASKILLTILFISELNFLNSLFPSILTSVLRFPAVISSREEIILLIPFIIWVLSKRLIINITIKKIKVKNIITIEICLKRSR